MNLFRLCGDLSHVLAILLLLLKIWKTRSAAGTSVELLSTHATADTNLCDTYLLCHSQCSLLVGSRVFTAAVDAPRPHHLLLTTGISGKSQVLFLIVYVTRYLDLFFSFISV